MRLIFFNLPILSNHKGSSDYTLVVTGLYQFKFMNTKSSCESILKALFKKSEQLTVNKTINAVYVILNDTY